MKDHILVFKKLYNRIRQKNMILPPAVIALKLLDTSQLDSNNRKLVLTAVDYNKMSTLFDQMKNALRKFHRQKVITTSSAPIKIEAALEATSESVYYGNNQRSNYRLSRPNNFPIAQKTTRNFESSRSSLENSRKRTNAIGLNVKPLKCRICESILHLMRDCPHRNENENEYFTLFTGDEIESCLLMSESRNSIILD